MSANAKARLAHTLSVAGTILLTAAAVSLSGCGSVKKSPDNAKLLAAAIEGKGPFCLSTEFQPLSFHDTLPTVLTRELGRQAVLIAARDGLGLSTRDETLGEAFPDDEAARRGPYELVVRKYDGGMHLDMRVPGVAVDNLPLRFFELDMPGKNDAGELYTGQATAFAAAARGDILAKLRAAGFEGKPVKSDPHGAMSDGIEAQLQVMDVVVQFDAVRQLHAAIAKQGESPARLGGLVRGYANLALLTRHHWSSAYAAFSARALLYAERLMTLDSGSAEAHQHRAYARALVGLPAAALADLEHDSLKQAASQPAWLAILEPYCRFERDKLLEKGAAPEVRSLANLLAFQLHSCYGNERWNISAGQTALKACPDAYGIYSELANHTPMLVQRQSVAAVADVIGRQIPAHVAHVDALPKPVFELVSDQLKPNASWISRYLRGERESKAWSPVPHQIAVALRQECKTAGDAGEPSWDALASLIDDEQFVAIVDYLDVSMNAVEYSKEEIVNQLAPLVEGRPYEPYLRSFAHGRSGPRSECEKFATQIRVRDPRPQMHKMITAFWDYADANGQTYCNSYNHSLWMADRTFPAMFAAINDISDSWWKNQAVLNEARPWVADFQAVVPQAPTTLRVEILTTEKPDLDQIAAWEERAADDPLALSRIGQLYNEQSKFDAAVRSFNKSYSLSPAYETAISLADAYRAAGKDEQWLPALEAYLQEEDYSLGHALIHQKIADDLIRQHKWAEAEPHALEAAQTWSAWGLTLAGQVCEGLGHWQESEKWYREAATSYPTYSAYQWYFWCCRTGRGDKEAARKAFDEFLQLDWVQSRAQGENYPLIDNLLSGNYQEVLEEIQSRSDYAENDYWQLHAALMAKRIGNEQLYGELIDATTKQVLETYRESDPNICKLYESIQLLAREGKLSEEQIASLDKLLEKFGPISTANYCYLLGEQLALHGDANNAEKYWRLSLSSGQFQQYNATLSGHRLAELHGTSQPDVLPQDAPEQSDSTAEAAKQAEEQAEDSI
ncbi:MAG: tetratricopeptide repeat protein [Pirellulales bacterium]